ncbi:MAG: hypothetical protein O7F71_07525 [Gammaproteobacteria bacterium]|nr:hypothetical protein [Gammaproteobacteria bacterium]
MQLIRRLSLVSLLAATATFAAGISAAEGDAAPQITVDSEPASGDMFIVMLHRDVNENQEFDFVFVDEVNVLDKAVFEGTKMIAHRYATP